MVDTMKAFMDFLEDEGIEFEYNEEMEAVRLTADTDTAGPMEIIIGFTDGGDTVAIRCEEFLEFKSVNRQQVLEVCNSRNLDYRWVRFGLYDEDNTVLVAMDVDLAMFEEPEDRVPQIRWGLDTLIGIGDEVYPEFTKAKLSGLS